MTRRRLRRFRDLPLIAQLLIPFLALMLFAGSFGVLVIVRDLSARGRTALEQDLSRRLLEARSALRDRELYLVESANFASNLAGVAARVGARDAAGVGQLMRSVLALKTDLSLLAVTAADGRGLLEFGRASGDEMIARQPSSTWQGTGLVREVLAQRAAAKSSGFVGAGGRRLLAIAAPICVPAATTCVPAGAAVVGIEVEALVANALASGRGLDAAGGVAVYDAGGRLIAGSGAKVERHLPKIGAGAIAQRTRTVGGVELATAYASLEIQGRPAGTLAVTIPTAPAFASARGAGTRLALVVVAVMAGIVALGALLSRSILAQVKPLVATNRALGEGDLSARAVVLSEGELGELARGVNQMAEQLQAIYGDLELRVEQRTEEVQRLLKERTEFFASISHELRTPLAVILGQGKMLVDPKYRKSARWTASAGQTIVQTTKQLIAVVNEILDLARADAGRLEMILEDIDIGLAMRELTSAFEDLARSSGVHLTMVHPMESIVVRADRRRLHGIFVNLVDNAVKYTPAGGAVTVSASANDSLVEVSVSDTGVGIPAEAGDLIFEPFYRVKGAAAQGGQASSGLGLALSKRLVEAQNGTMWFTSKPGKGSTFTFALPRVAKQKRRPSTPKRGSLAGG